VCATVHADVAGHSVDYLNMDILYFDFKKWDIAHGILYTSAVSVHVLLGFAMILYKLDSVLTPHMFKQLFRSGLM